MEAQARLLDCGNLTPGQQALPSRLLGKGVDQVVALHVLRGEQRAVVKLFLPYTPRAAGGHPSNPASVPIQCRS